MRVQSVLPAVLLPVFLVASLSSISAHAGTPELGYTDTSVVAGLQQPTALAFLPDGRILVTEQTGDLELVNAGVATTLVNIPVCRSQEMGLLGVAVDPNFASNGFIYMYRTNEGGIGSPCNGPARKNEIVRVTMAPDDTVDIASLVVLLTGIGTDGGNHDGGGLRVGPDGKLYAGAGDSGVGDNQGGPGSSTNPFSQDLGSLNGKVLRINRDGTIPGDNPFVGMPGIREEIYSYGFRNPFRLNFDPATDSLWVGDVGDGTYEEIDIATPGGNYSWPYCEAERPTGCAQPGDVAPVFFYPHLGPTSLGNCVIGGAFAGAAFDAESGDYVFGDCTKSRIYRAALNATRDGFASDPVRIASNAGTPADFVTGPDGAIYYTVISGDEVRRISRQLGDRLLLGKTLTLQTRPPEDSFKRLSVSSSDTGLDVGFGDGSTADPFLHGGTLRVVASGGDAFDDTYVLPAGANWKYIGGSGSNKGYLYRDTSLAAGPIRSLSFKPGRLLKVSAGGAGLLHTLGADPGTVSVTLTLGDQRYCLSFSGGTFETDRLYRAKDTQAPLACAP